MASKINPRWLRKGRIAYKGDGDFAILLESMAPGTWRVASVSPLGAGTTNARTAKVTTGSITLRYDRLLQTPNSLPFSPDVITSLKALINILNLSANTIDKSWGSRLERILEAREKGITGAAVSEAKASAAPVTRAVAGFTVQTYDPDSYFYESDEDASLYEDFVAMRKALHPVNLLIAGPSGSGKTEGIKNLGKKLGIPVHIINCQAITTPEKWIGQMQADPEQGTYFVPSQHIQWVERTHEDCEGFEYCILLYDEITRLRPELNNMTYSLFDTQRGLEVPQMNRRVLMSQENMVVATANIGSAFTGTHTQDRAFRERFALTMERGFPPTDKEIKILTTSTGITAEKARDLVRVANGTRKLWENDEIESPISTRTLKAWALLVAGNYSVKQAAEYTVIPLYSNDGGAASDRTRVAGLIEGKVV